jgi:hypothetical protein
MFTSTTLSVLIGLLAVPAGGLQLPAPPAAPVKPSVDKIGHQLFRIGRIRVDTGKREISVPGRVNDAHVLEFVASTQGGLKAYESAISLETDGVTFNAAMLLIGLDKKNARVPTRHFDPVPPAGDPVDIWIEWNAEGKPRRERVEHLLFDVRTRQPMPPGPWVYTGSTFIDDGRYLADTDGVLIGFVHSPAPVIENPREGAVASYGFIILNPRLGLPPESPITLIVSAAAPAKR